MRSRIVDDSPGAWYRTKGALGDEQLPFVEVKCTRSAPWGGLIDGRDNSVLSENDAQIDSSPRFRPRHRSSQPQLQLPENQGC